MKSILLTAILFFISVVTAEPKREMLSSVKVTLASQMGESFELTSSKIDGQTVYLITHFTAASRLGEQVVTQEMFKELQKMLQPLMSTKFSAPCTHPAVMEWTKSKSVRQNLICSENKKGQIAVKAFVEKAKGYLKF